MEYLSAFNSKTGETIFLNQYDECLKTWPVPYDEDYIETDIGTTYAIKCGNKQGPVLVLLHGKGATSAMWSYNIAELARTYYIIALDIPTDANKSRFKKTFDNTREAADWLSSVMDKMGIGRFSVMGVSFGSFYAMIMAVHETERVESLIIIAPTISFTGLRIPFWYRSFKVALSPFDSTKVKYLDWLSAGKLGQLPKESADLQIMNMKYTNIRIKPLIHQFNDEELTRIKIPVLMLIGKQEVVTEIDDVVARATRLIKNLQYKIIDDAGHTLVSTKPAIVNPIIQDFLNGVHAGIKS